MGAVPSTPRRGAQQREKLEKLLGVFIGGNPVPLSSEFWHELLELPLTIQWPEEKVLDACQSLAENNPHTRHLAKVMIILVSCLQELFATGSEMSSSYVKAINAMHISSIFLKYLIENSKSNNFSELSLDLDEELHDSLSKDRSIENYVMRGLLSFISNSEISPHSCLLHHEVLNLLLLAMSTQLRCGPSLGPKDVHPFLDAMMEQESSLVSSVVEKLFHTYISQPQIHIPSSPYHSAVGGQANVFQKVGSVAANLMLLPYHTLNYLVSSGGGSSRSLLADNSLLVLLVLVHYKKCIVFDEPTLIQVEGSPQANGLLKGSLSFHENPYNKALETATDTQFVHVEKQGHGQLVRLPFASLFDSLGVCLFDESSVLLLYSLVHGNPAFLEYVLVRTDLDTLLMPMLEMLYSPSKRTSNQIYMLLIILLILSQDSSFNASIHKLMFSDVPWYQERRLHHTSLGSLMVVILIRTVKYNLSKLRDVYLHTNCLATLANMAPHVHRLSAYAAQRLVSLFYMLSRKYVKLADLSNDNVVQIKVNSIDGSGIDEDMASELQIYTDFLRIVLEILNAILVYALPRNPEVVYAIMHRQEVFEPFKNHPRFSDLLENVYMVLDFFNSRMDAQNMHGGWSVQKVLEVIIINCRSWRGEGMKMFTQLRFTYEQEHHPEEFFIPYVWQLILSSSGMKFSSKSICLYPVNVLPEEASGEEAVEVVNDGESV